MTLQYEDAGLRLWHGSNKDILPTFDAESFDSIVTDPPYELGFMGKGWDSSGIAYDVDLWRECWRVLKPGGYLLSFGGTRTWHRIAVAIEDAGFEIRDSIAWMYGSGFPKSMNVAKAIATGSGRPEDIRRLNMGEAYAPSGRGRVNYDNGGGSKMNGASVVDVDLPDEAKAWGGWGTALKPAFEPIIVARKPLRGTVAANVLVYGTGAINIDATRVQYKSDADRASAIPQGKATARVGALAGKVQQWESDITRTEPFTTASTKGTSVIPSTGSVASADGTARTEFTPSQSDRGRFPSNVLLDESQAAELDKQSGWSRSRVGMPRSAASGEGWGMTATGAEYDDAGGASRFFPTFRYEAKAPGSERPEVDGMMHATVKPLELMRWLVRLVTRPGGRVLDPFAGSGTTGEAALLEGMEVDLIELEADHLPLILQRVRKPLQPSMFGDWEGIA